MAERVVRLRIDAASDVDDEELTELTELTLRLANELRELDVGRVDPVPGEPPPPGARGGEAFVAGALIVTLMQSSELLPKLVDTVLSWISRSNARSLVMMMDDDLLVVPRVRSREQRELIQLWIDRHTDQ